MDEEAKILSTVDLFRQKLGARSFDSITTQQGKTTGDAPARGPVWVSRTTVPCPSDKGLYDAVMNKVKSMADTGEKWDPTSVTTVAAQWIGVRSNADKGAKEASISEKDKYTALAQDTKSDVVIFYIFGGAYYSGGPASARPAASALATLTGGRSFVPIYRLSPQHSFPSPLVDLFLAYVSLLYPPPGSFHQAVDPSNIVIAGDSAGGTLGLALMHVIKRNPRIRFNGADVDLALPAGFASLGCETDHSHSFPSYRENAKYDLLQIPQPLLQDKFPACEVWPTSPPRGDIYCDSSAFTHPLVSPALADSWKGFPPLWFAYGQEQMLDDGLFVAQRAQDEQVVVQVHRYALLPHIFAFLLPTLPQSKHVFQNWAKFCSDCTTGRQNLRSRHVVYEVGDGSFKGRSLGQFSQLKIDEARRLISQRGRERQAWTGPKIKAAM